ncbi:ribosome hibernation-promoting factor, HPF/YfiA family [Phreatobacter stygius]|uniref:Ribosome-associated translation inhibitor RaiA n=1 Tax=Phreatobacter stygius TaxID=1940610 RepID=A0A4D7B0P4_9HYPH|nr:ribosome-associated translation inhibitor RaiA [Phreatobacter stygius]QCI63006.1 ribosome-associated translation inhibitor RaiA [Phreatobacter stygius]
MKLDDIDRVILVKSADVELGSALPQHVRESITRVARKYFGELTAASVYFSHEGPSIRSTFNVQMGSLKMISASSLAPDCYQAFDMALDKAAKQLRRKKRELRDTRPGRPNKLTIPFENPRI